MQCGTICSCSTWFCGLLRSGCGVRLEVMDAEIYVLTLFWLETARLLPSSLSLLQSTLKKAVNVAAGLLKVQ